MFLEIIPEMYDSEGRKSYKPHLKKALMPPTYPFGRYVSRPLTIHCQNYQEMQEFLSKCKLMADIEAFGKDEYWSPPDQFEKEMRGDCDDFALWTWRQLMQMGYLARFVAGHYGRYRSGHCWVTFRRDGKQYLAEPTLSFIRKDLPTLQILKYHPIYSVEWDGSRISFYSHQEDRSGVGFPSILKLVPPWLWFWTIVWIRSILRLTIYRPRYLWRCIGGKRRKLAVTQSVSKSS